MWPYTEAVHFARWYCWIWQPEGKPTSCNVPELNFKVWFLQPNSFAFVSRSANSFRGNIESVLWCSCDPQRSQIADCLPTVNAECFLSFEQSLPACIHIMAAKILLREVDRINDITPTLDFSGIVLHISSKSMTDYCFHSTLVIRSQLCIHRYGRRMGGEFKWYLIIFMCPMVYTHALWKLLCT